MDPITGLAALLGISLASVAGLRLKKRMEEGFTSVLDANSLQESQSRYNMFSGLVNPITNSIIPVGSPDKTIKQQKETVNAALGSFAAEFSPDSSQTLVLKKFENQFQARSDDSKSLYGAMKFCREAGQTSSPFTTYNSDGSVKVQGAVSADKQWKFDEVCGVCLTSGVDEEGNRFRKVQGMIVEPNARDKAIQDQDQNGWAYPRIGPSLGTCEGAPNNPVFATTAKDFERFKARQACLGSKTLGGPDACGLCFESNDVYSSVPSDAQTNPVSFALQGLGTVVLQIKGQTIGQKELSDSNPTTMELTGAKEGDTFLLTVTGTAQTVATVYGYMFSRTPKDGLYTMPLNLLVTVDDETGSSPSKSGGFYNFSEIGLDVAKIRAASGKTRMRLRGVLPFTFVQPSEFSAMDCLDAPYQKLASSANAFSTDQPCFAKGSKPGNYNDACLRQRILDAGCTNAGDLYKNPQGLNTKDGAVQTITQIYTALQAIANQDMIDPVATKQCSGRTIETPCDPFIQRAGTLKFGSSLQSTNATLSTQAKQCLSYLYHNKGANETTNPPRVGPTYSGLTLYRNNQKDVKNIYCLPEGALNPDTSATAVDTLARIADNGYQSKIGVEAIKEYLSNQLALATDGLKNANSDPDRKAAITNCFGTNLSNLPAAITGNPTVITNPCGVMAQYVRVLPSQMFADGYVEMSQIAVIDKTGTNVAPGKSTAGTTQAYPTDSLGAHAASYAIDGQIYPKGTNFYISAFPRGNAQFLLNLGKLTDITKIIFIARGDNNNRYVYRKNGMILQLLDANQKVVDEKRLNNSLREEIFYQLPGADASCKMDMAAPAPIVFPPGYSAGVYVRFFDITDPNPDIEPGNRGWGGRLGTANAYGKIQFNDTNLARYDRCGVVAKGFYIASGPETLYLMTDSDDGMYVTFNNVQVIRNWSIHGPARDASAPIRIPSAGIYPFELRFYEWGGGAVCNLYYRINDEATWRTDLSARFAYKPADITIEEQAYQAKLLAAQQKTPVMWGPWIGGGGNGEVRIQQTFTLRDGKKVYAIQDGPYTKMVTETGEARYYTGNFTQFNANNWTSYASAGTNYRLKFI